MTGSPEVKAEHDSRTIWLIGGTGLTGQQVIKELCQDGHHVISLVRTASTHPHPRLSEFQIDFEALADQGHAALPSLPKPEILISAFGTTQKKAGTKQQFYRVDHDYVSAFAKAGHSKGANHILFISSVGANRHASSFYLRVKGECEASISACNFSRTDIFRPGLLLGHRQERRYGEHIAARILPLLSPILPKSYHAIRSHDVAKAIARAVRQTKSGRYIHQNKEIWESIA